MSRGRTVELAGWRVRYQSDTAAATACLDWFFGALEGAGDGPVALEIGVPAGAESDAATAAVAVPAGAPDRRHGPIERWERGGAVWLRHESGARGHVTGHRFTIECGPAAGEPWRALRHLLFDGLSWWFERQDLLLLHGALLARGGDAALVLGPTGSGKSTLAIAGLAAGWELCSDDLVLATCGAPGARDVPGTWAFGIPKRPTVEVGLLDASPLAARLGALLDPLPGDARTRAMLPAGSLSVGWRQVRIVVVAGHDDGPGEVVGLPHGELLAAVLAAFLEADRPAVLRRQLRQLAALGALPGFRLLHPAPAADRLPTAARLLATAWGAGHPSP